MKVGDIIGDHKACESISGWPIVDNCATGRIVKEIRFDKMIFQLDGDSTSWFKISDFETQDNYEIY